MDIPRQPPASVLRFLEQAANRLLEMDSGRQALLAPIAGKAIAIEFLTLQSRIVVLPNSDGLALAAAHDGAVDVTIRGAPGDMLAYLAGDSAAAGGGLEIAGDVAAAERLQSVMKKLDPDWEEALSQWVGDTGARKLGNLLRASLGWTRAAARSTLGDFEEYLRYEGRAVPEPEEVGRFVEAVDRLRDDVQRLQARLDRLGGRVAAGER